MEVSARSRTWVTKCDLTLAEFNVNLRLTSMVYSALQKLRSHAPRILSLV
jgi:hypothetical protein